MLGMNRIRVILGYALVQIPDLLFAIMDIIGRYLPCKEITKKSQKPKKQRKYNPLKKQIGKNSFHREKYCTCEILYDTLIFLHIAIIFHSSEYVIKGKVFLYV